MVLIGALRCTSAWILLVLKETMPAVQPKAKMMPAYEPCQRVAIKRLHYTHQHNVREREQEERPLEVLPVSRLVLWVISPELQPLQDSSLLISRKHLTHSFRCSALCLLQAFLSIVMVISYTALRNGSAMFNCRKGFASFKQEAREHSLFKTTQDDQESTGFDDGSDPA